MRYTIAAAAALSLLVASAIAGQTGSTADVFDRVTHGYATSEGGVKIHYASLGSGPLVVMIHGFPDFWYSWRHQMAALADRFQVVAIDQRGYNLSDKPKGVENYDAALLVGDVAAVSVTSAASAPPSSGTTGAAWWPGSFAMNRPQMTEKLIILNLPHPTGLARELREQRGADCQQRVRAQLPAEVAGRPDGVLRQADDRGDALGLGPDPAARKRYVEAFERSDFEAMLNYYKRNYPRTAGPDAPVAPDLLRCRCRS